MCKKSYFYFDMHEIMIYEIVKIFLLMTITNEQNE